MQRDAGSPWPVGPRRPPAPSVEVHVWRAELDAAGWPAAEGLPVEERERARKMPRPESARRWVAARWALRHVLSRYLNEGPAQIALTLDAHGKPELASAPGRLSFNLSHSAGLALVAVTAGRGVGVDVERIDADRDFIALAARALDPDASATVAAAAPGDRAAVFYEAWVRHEALVKCLGSGLGNPRPEAAVAVAPLDIDGGYAAALAVAGREALVRRCYSLHPLSSA